MFWEDVVGWDDTEPSDVAPRLPTAEEIERTLLCLGSATAEDYLADEEVYHETLTLYRSLLAYIDLYRPGILQRLTWDDWVELVLATTDVRAAPPGPRAPPPLPLSRHPPRWERRLTTLGTRP